MSCWPGTQGWRWAVKRSSLRTSSISHSQHPPLCLQSSLLSFSVPCSPSWTPSAPTLGQSALITSCWLSFWLCVISVIIGFVLSLSLLALCCLCHCWLFVVSVITGFVLPLSLSSLLALCCVHISFLLSPLLLASCSSLLAFLFIIGFLLSPSLLASCCHHHYWHFVVSIIIGFLHRYCVLTIPEMSASPWPILTLPLPYASATFVVLLLTRNCNCTDCWQVCRVVLAKWTLGSTAPTVGRCVELS